MTKRIAPHFIDELQGRVDIVDVINARVPLKKAGKDFQACCPFHNEKTPSFTVSAQKQFYYCFGCGAKGGAINFLMEFEHLSFVDAVEQLSAENGIDVQYEQLSPSAVAKVERKKNLQDLLAEAATLYENNFNHTDIGGTARNYLSTRQLDKETTAFFRLGYAQAGNRLQTYFGSNVDAEMLIKAGLLARGEHGTYDFFRDRLMFPIRDTRGRVLGFGARALGDVKPKYLNTGDTELFNKSNVLYGLYEELQTNRHIDYLIVVEGYMDVIALHQMGVQGAVAALGTAFTQGHLHLVRRYSKKLFICFDGDNAGKRAAQRAMETILPGMSTDTEIRMVFLPDGEDPDTLVRKIGKNAFVERLEAGQYFSEFVCDSIIGDSNLNLIEGRGEMAVRAKRLFDLMPDGAYKNALQQELTDKAGRDIYQLAQEATRQIQRQRQTTFVSHSERPRYTPRAVVLRGGLESRLIRLLLAMPDLAFCVRHEGLLRGSDSMDGELLYRLLQFFQWQAVDGASDNEQQIHSALSAFDGALGERLSQILATEKLPESNAVLEEREQGWRQAFVAGVEKLLSETQQKMFFADLK